MERDYAPEGFDYATVDRAIRIRLVRERRAALKADRAFIRANPEPKE